MKVTFTNLGYFKTELITLCNVIWVRVTENKVMIECQDGRHFEYRLKNICEFEVLHA